MADRVFARLQRHGDPAFAGLIHRPHQIAGFFDRGKRVIERTVVIVAAVRGNVQICVHHKLLFSFRGYAESRGIGLRVKTAVVQHVARLRQDRRKAARQQANTQYDPQHRLPPPFYARDLFQPRRQQQRVTETGDSRADRGVLCATFMENEHVDHEGHREHHARKDRAAQQRGEQHAFFRFLLCFSQQRERRRAIQKDRGHGQRVQRHVPRHINVSVEIRRQGRQAQQAQSDIPKRFLLFHDLFTRSQTEMIC